MADRLIVKGLGSVDGDYEFDLLEMLSVGTPSSLTNRELHRIKVMTGLRAAEILDAFAAGDNDVVVALAATILTRRGKAFAEDTLWDAPAETGLALELGEREQQEDPQTPTVEAETVEPSQSGGGSSSQSSASPENVRSLTGIRDSETLSKALA